MSSDAIDTPGTPPAAADAGDEPRAVATAPGAPAALPPPLPPGYTYAPVRRPDPKSPIAALLLSILFPGLGQVYNGQISKALMFFGIWAGCLYSMIKVDPLPWVFVMIFTTLFSYVDAWRSAAQINAHAAGSPTPAEPEDVSESPLWGGALLAFGALLLLNNLEILSLEKLQVYWPALLIVAGGITLWNSLKRQQAAKEAAGEARSED
jgi:hypothetical protein